MGINKKIYKYTSIISITIVFMLIINIILPIFSIADQKSSNITIEHKGNLLELKGTAPTGYEDYIIYWKEGEMNIEHPAEGASDDEKNEYMENVIGWYMIDTSKDVEETKSPEIKSTLEIDEVTKDITYNALIVAKSGTAKEIVIVSKTLYAPTKIENTIDVKLSAEGKKINIKITDTTYDIVKIKYKKSDTSLKVEDFENVTDTIDFTGTKDITTSKDVTEDGRYYIYVENSAGAKTVESVTISTEGNQNTSDIVIKLGRLNSESEDENPTVYVNVSSSKTHNINGIKYYVSDNVIENMATVRDNGTSININSSISISETGMKNKYLSIYATDDGNCESFVSKHVGNIELYDTLPWGEPGGDQPGGGSEEPGGDQPGGGSEEPGGDQPGGGSEEPGGDQPGGGSDEPGGDQTGGGSDEPGGDQQGSGNGNTGGNQQGSGNGNTGGDQQGSGNGNTGGNQQGSGNGNTGGNQQGSGNGNTGGNQQGSGNGNTGGNQQGSESGNTSGNQQGSGNGNITGGQQTDKNTTIDVKQDKNVNDDLPQTGSNDSFVIIAIIAFSILSLASYAKYKTIK